MEGIEFADGFIIIRDKPLILKLRSLGAGVEEGEETRISFLEAAYFAGRKVIPLEAEEILSKSRERDKLSDEKFAVIKHLRDRGYIVRPSLDGSGYLRLHRKGFRPGEDKTYYLIEVLPEGERLALERLFPSLEAAGRLRKELALAFVGKEKITFIKFGRMDFE